MGNAATAKKGDPAENGRFNVHLCILFYKYRAMLFIDSLMACHLSSSEKCVLLDVGHCVVDLMGYRCFHHNVMN